MDLWATVLFNYQTTVLDLGIPDSWSTSIIVPIFKKGFGSEPRCYRPISLVDGEVKVMGRVILNRLQSWADEHDILTDVQYGFRKGRGTIEQCLNLQLVIGKYTVGEKGFSPSSLHGPQLRLQQSQ